MGHTTCHMLYYNSNCPDGTEYAVSNSTHLCRHLSYKVLNCTCGKNAKARKRGQLPDDNGIISFSIGQGVSAPADTV